MRLLAKVCGLARPEDAALAARAGADLLGFVVHPPSPRHCADLAIAAPYLDRAVLVMVAGDGEAVLDMARRHGFRRVQPHLPAAARRHGAALLRAAGLSLLLPWADEADQEPLPAELYLWEPSPARTGRPGGSGEAHAMVFPPPGPFLLAGGLDGTRLGPRATALSGEVRPLLRGFDAASRLEASPGLKDPQRVAAFVTAAHRPELP